MKICSNCGAEKDLSDFNRKTKGTFNSWCRVCSNGLSRRHYEKNKQVYFKRNAAVKQRNAEWIYTYLVNNSCMDCGEADPVVLHFDHVRGVKRFAICSPHTHSLKTLRAEIDKCEVRCANCHMRRTAKMGNFFRYRKFVTQGSVAPM